MKKLFVVLFVTLAVSLTASAQLQGRENVGLRVLSGDSLEASYVDFGRKLYDMKLSPQQDYLLLKFRDVNKKGTLWKNKGEIGMLRLADMKLLWTQPYNYTWPDVRLTQRGVLLTSDSF